MAERTILTTTKVTVDDLTGNDMGRYGFELRTRRGDKTFHFTSLTNLAEALLDRPEIFGMVARKRGAQSDFEHYGYIRTELRRKGVLV